MKAIPQIDVHVHGGVVKVGREHSENGAEIVHP